MSFLKKKLGEFAGGFLGSQEEIRPAQKEIKIAILDKDGNGNDMRL